MNMQLSFTASPAPYSTRTDSSAAAKATEVLEPSRAVNKEAADLTDNTGEGVPVGEEQLIRSIERAIKSMQGPQTTLEISVHEKTHAIMVKVLNKETGDLIREVPSEKIMDIVANMMEIAGIIIDERV